MRIAPALLVALVAGTTVLPTTAHAHTGTVNLQAGASASTSTLASSSTAPRRPRVIRQRALKLLAAAVPTAVRINSGGNAVVDADGNSWRADAYVTGGKTWDSGLLVASSSPVVDRSERIGNMTYAVPVVPGNYTVRLHLTELYWTTAGKRLFNITAEGRSIASNVDILTRTSPLRTTVLDIPLALDAQLNLQLTTVRDNASITGIEVLPRTTALTPAPSPSPTASPTPTPSPTPIAVAPVTSVPTTTSKGSLTPRPCTRTYALSGMQVGTGGDAVANGSRLRSVLAGTQAGDCLTVAPGHYRLAGNVEFTVPNVTLRGLGASREDVWFEHTTETRALFMVKAGGVHFYNFTHRVRGTARSSLGQSGEGNIWVQGGHSGFRMQDVLAWGSRDAAIFLYGVHHFELNRVESRDSRSDAYHISNGSSYGTWYDSKSTNSGDDGLGFVGYGGEGAGTPHHHTVVRHHVAGQTWGRGIGLIHVNNITFHGPTRIEATAGAGVIMAREPQYGSGSIRAIRFYGELRFVKANHHSSIDHGAIHMHNPGTDAPIEDVLITGPVVLVDTGVLRTGGVSFQVRAHGAGRIQAEIRNASFYGSGPSTRVSTSLAAGSSLLTPGWSNSSPYLGAAPAYPLG